MIDISFREPSLYYSFQDEDFFFAWLKDLDGMGEVEIFHPEIRLHLSDSPAESHIRDLIALLYRYGLDLTPLRALVSEENRSWLCNPSAYWYQSMFVEQPIQR